MTAITVLVMLAVLAMMLITSEGKRDALHRNQELVDASLEGLVVAQTGRIVNVNRRIIELTGKPAEELIGQSVTGDLLTGDCAEASSQATGMSLRTAAGITVPVEVVRRPLTGSTRANEVYAIRDLTERRRDEAALQAQNARLDLALAKLEQQKTDLDVALENMSQGLAMFDAEERLVLANDRYAEIYGLDPAHSRPGTTLRELVEHRLSKGLYAGMTVSGDPGEHAGARGSQTGEPSREPAGRRAHPIRFGPPSSRRRLGGYAARLDRARAPQRAAEGAELAPATARGGAGRAERALRCRHQQHVAGHVPL